MVEPNLRMGDYCLIFWIKTCSSDSGACPGFNLCKTEDGFYSKTLKSEFMKVKVDLKNKSDVEVVYFEYFRSQRCLGNHYPAM